MSDDKPTEEAAALIAEARTIATWFDPGETQIVHLIGGITAALEGALVRERTAKAETVVQEVSVERMAHFLSEWLDDQAPIHERRVYRMVAEDLTAKFAVTQRHEDGCKLHMFPSWPSEICTCIPPLPTPADPEES